MPGTNLTDIIVPELFNAYVVSTTLERSALAQSGIINAGPAFDMLASLPGQVAKMPFFDDLGGESEQIIEDDDLTADKIEPGIDIAPILRRAKMWSATDLSAAMAGADPMAAVGQLVAGFWTRDMQKELVAILKGVFGSASMAGNSLDISALTGDAAKWNASAFIDAGQLLGDAQELLTAVVMHSATKASLKKQDLIDTVRPSEFVEFDTYQGKRVIVDDDCPVADDVYTTYLFGEGAVALGNGCPEGFVATEIDRDKKKGSGVDYLINRKTYILHPRGVKFTAASMAKAEGPSRTELSQAANWVRVYEPKQIRIVQFTHKI